MFLVVLLICVIEHGAAISCYSCSEFESEIPPPQELQSHLLENQNYGYITSTLGEVCSDVSAKQCTSASDRCISSNIRLEMEDHHVGTVKLYECGNAWLQANFCDKVVDGFEVAQFDSSCYELTCATDNCNLPDSLLTEITSAPTQKPVLPTEIVTASKTTKPANDTSSEEAPTDNPTEKTESNSDPAVTHAPPTEEIPRSPTETGEDEGGEEQGNGVEGTQNTEDMNSVDEGAGSVDEGDGIVDEGAQDGNAEYEGKESDSQNDPAEEEEEEGLDEENGKQKTEVDSSVCTVVWSWTGILISTFMMLVM